MAQIVDSAAGGGEQNKQNPNKIQQVSLVYGEGNSRQKSKALPLQMK